MAITQRICNGITGINELALVVEVLGMVITVKAGSFKLVGISQTFAEDQVINLGTSIYKREVTCHLVLDPVEDEIYLLVNEFILDGEHDRSQGIIPAGHQGLDTLFEVQIPENTVDLAGLPIPVLTMPAQAPPEAPELPEPSPVP